MHNNQGKLREKRSPDTEQRRQVAYLVNVQNLTSGLLHLAHLVHEVPESGLGVHLVAGEELHSVSRRVLVRLGGRLAADHLVQLHLNNQ